MKTSLNNQLRNLGEEGLTIKKIYVTSIYSSASACRTVNSLYDKKSLMNTPAERRNSKDKNARLKIFFIVSTGRAI